MLPKDAAMMASGLEVSCAWWDTGKPASITNSARLARQRFSSAASKASRELVVVAYVMTRGAV